MNELLPVYATASIIVGLIVVQALRRRLDPFAPVWLFLVGYTQVYVVQAISYHDWALKARGVDLVSSANLRALWALVWFLIVYYSPIGRRLAGWLPRPPRQWSSSVVTMVSPPLILWGLICSGMLLRQGAFTSDPSAQGVSDGEALFRSFPAVMLVGAILILVTGRAGPQPRPSYLWAGVAVAVMYVFIWMFNGKRSHSLLGVLVTLCAFYTSKFKRPSWPVLCGTALVGVMVVALAIGWRGNSKYEHNFSGFFEYMSEFDPSSALVALNVKARDGAEKPSTHETEEYGGFLLMMDTVPEKSEFDYGENYLRVFSTFIPRIIWKSKPLFGREQWVNAWIAGSELPRDKTFTGPAIGILGATQLNGGAWGTLIVLACLAVLIRTAYEYFLRYQEYPWAQAWWALTYINAWFMTVADDPLNWFYYNYGFTTAPPLAFFFLINRFGEANAPEPSWSYATEASWA